MADYLPRLGKREMKMLLSITRSCVVSVRGGGSFSAWRLGQAALFHCDTPWTFPITISSAYRNKYVVCLKTK